jgi:Nitrous oxide-stimulated promoter
MRVMIRMYCVTHHQGLRVFSEIEPTSSSRAGNRLCHECTAVLEYSFRRIESCRFGDEKPTCDQCQVHCFLPETRDQVRTVMRYSGPRMTIRHSYLAVRHLLDARRSHSRF